MLGLSKRNFNNQSVSTFTVLYKNLVRHSKTAKVLYGLHTEKVTLKH